MLINLRLWNWAHIPAEITPNHRLMCIVVKTLLNMYGCQHYYYISECKIIASFIPSTFSVYSQIMPLAIMIFSLVWFPHLVVEIENHVSIFHCKIYPISLENRNKIKDFKIWPSSTCCLTQLQSYKVTIKTWNFKINVKDWPAGWDPDSLCSWIRGRQLSLSPDQS